MPEIWGFAELALTQHRPKGTTMTADRNDLDETRRLLYMALAASRTERYNLAGTLTNALCHHEGNLGMESAGTLEHVMAAVEGEEGSLKWVHRRIVDLTALIDALPDDDDEQPRPAPYICPKCGSEATKLSQSGAASIYICAQCDEDRRANA